MSKSIKSFVVISSSFALMLSLSTALWGGTTGKIAGRVADAATDEPLAGANVMIVGTSLGAATDENGNYFILNVPPGTYDLNVTYIGYSRVVIEGARSLIDLTTTIDVAMQTEAIAGEEVVVTAILPVIQPDVSANVANVEAEEMVNVPVAGISEFINLQSGIEPGLRIRGSDIDQMVFLVDGMTTRDGREGAPFTNISYTAIDQFQIQTGGFNAEHGNVRSGLINVITKEGARDRYSADVLVRYSPPAKTYFGMSPGDDMSHYMRAYVDPEVAFIGNTGKDGPWDEYSQQSYERFEGWNPVVARYNTENPDAPMTTQNAQDLFRFRHRKDFEPDTPNWVIDGSIGGPVPVLSRLGDTRFFASYREVKRPYIVRVMRDGYVARTGQIKVTSNISEKSKLVISGLVATEAGFNAYSDGGTTMHKGEMPKYPWDTRGSLFANRLGNETIYSYYNRNPTDFNRYNIGLNFTQALSPSTLYEVSIQRNFTKYSTKPGRERDFDTVVEWFGPYGADEAPQGWTWKDIFDDTGVHRLSGHWGRGRDTSDVAEITARLDFTSQWSQVSQIKAGVEYIHTNHHNNHGEWDLHMIHHANPQYLWDKSIGQAAAYLQNKLEFRGMITNFGVRVDLAKVYDGFYAYEDYDDAFTVVTGFRELSTVPTEETAWQAFLSPRLGISFPISVDSKLFFNYGHFRQMLGAQALSGIRMVHWNQIDRIGNPEHPMPLTVAWEVGYEQSFMGEYLLRATGYQRSLSDQSSGVRYVNLDGMVDYQVYQPLSYSDSRGFEATLEKKRGRYVRGFVNFTLNVRKGGNFGYDTYYQNAYQQSQYEYSDDSHYPWDPVPEPFARFNLEFLVPPDFQPGILADWRVTFLGEWRGGQTMTWTGEDEIEGIRNNLRWKDFYGLDVRLSKTFSTSFGNVQLFADIENALNLKYLNRGSAFMGSYDWEYYMLSLHLPEEIFDEIDGKPYPYPTGTDEPGDYCKEGTDWVPLECFTTEADLKEHTFRFLEDDRRVLGWASDTEKYFEYNDDTDSWAPADAGFVDTVLEDKAYINMPNDVSFRFLNPRQIWVGIRVSF